MVRVFFSSCLILLFSAVFEAAVLSNIVFLPAVPDISLLCILFFSVNNGKIIGEGTGFFSGLFLDFLSACPLGLNCLLRAILGYFGGMFNKTLNIEGFFVPVFLGFCATIAKMILVLVIAFVFPNTIAPYSIFSLSFLFEIILNSILCPFVFRFLRFFKNAIILNPENVVQ